MIKELRLKNWKSFEEATLYIDPLTILIGANASGKSNTLDALMFLSRVSNGFNFFQAITGDSIKPPLRGGVEWICLKPHKEFTLEVVTDSENENEEYLYHLTVEVDATSAEVKNESLSLLDYSKSNTSPNVTILFTGSPDPDGSFGEFLIPFYFQDPQGDIDTVNIEGNASVTFGSRDRGILNYLEVFISSDLIVAKAIKSLLKQFREILVFDPIPSHMRDYAPLSKRLLEDGSNVAGVLAALEDLSQQKVEETLSHYLKALPEKDIIKVWAEKIGRLESDAMLYCEEGWSATSTQEIDARGMSDGTLRYLGIVAALLTREEGSLLVIEEVDNGLHPSRANALLDMLKTLGKERNIDVIVTTHNPALLDAAGITMLPYIAMAYRDETTGCSKLKQLEDLKAIPKLLASGNLGKLSTEGRIIDAIQHENQS